MSQQDNTPAAYLAAGIKLYTAVNTPHQSIWRKRLHAWQANFAHSITVELSCDLVLRVRDPKTGQVLAESAAGQLLADLREYIVRCKPFEKLVRGMQAHTPATYLAEGLKLYDAVHYLNEPIWHRHLRAKQANFGHAIDIELSRDLVLRVLHYQTRQVLAESEPAKLAELSPSFIQVS